MEDENEIEYERKDHQSQDAEGGARKMAKKTPKLLTGFVAAEPGTKLVLFALDTESETATHRTEHRVVAWEVNHNKLYDIHWAMPVALGAEELSENFYAVVFSDGYIHYQEDGFARDFEEQEFKSVEQFGAYVEKYHKDLLERARCLDCKTSLLGQIPSDHSPVLKDEIWKAIVPDGEGLLCRPCMEQRLGREITPADFKPEWVGATREAAEARIRG